MSGGSLVPKGDPLDNAGRMTSMYETYWQLNRKPFENTADPGSYYPCDAHQGALLKIRYAIENSLGAALLVGPSGSGKTMLIQTLKRKLADRYTPVAHVVFPQMPPEELLAYIADDLNQIPGGTPGDPGMILSSVRRIETALDKNSAAGRHAVLVIDEAHLLTDVHVWEALRLLSNYQDDMGAQLTLVLCGQPSLLPALDRMPQWEERLGVKCLLRPLSLEETMSYVSHRLTAAGARTAIFEAAAVEAVFYTTHGNPRKINRLCDLALLIAFAEEQTSVTAAQIEAVAQELVTVAPE